MMTQISGIQTRNLLSASANHCTIVPTMVLRIVGIFFKQTKNAVVCIESIKQRKIRNKKEGDTGEDERRRERGGQRISGLR